MLAMAVALGKALASAAVPAVATWYTLSFLGVHGAPCAAASAFVGLIGFCFYARAWVQGYYFDHPYHGTADLSGRTVLVTGGTRGGLGFAGAELLAQLGATIVLTVRSDAKGTEAVEALKQVAGHERISYTVVDFHSLASVRECAKAFLAQHDRLDYLVLNAGIGRGRPEDVWMTNQVGPFLFTDLLRPLLEKTAKVTNDVRVVAVSSGAHKGASICFESPYDPPSGGAFSGPYGQSKLAQIMHMRELQRRMRASSRELSGEAAVRCIAVTPGFALTNIFDAPAAARVFVRPFARSAWMGAQVIKMACIGQDVPGGSYLSNCYLKPTEGLGGCSNDPAQWIRLWELCEKCVNEARFP